MQAAKEATAAVRFERVDAEAAATVKLLGTHELALAHVGGLLGGCVGDEALVTHGDRLGGTEGEHAIYQEMVCGHIRVATVIEQRRRQ